jgi:hypothetical protein
MYQGLKVSPEHREADNKLEIGILGKTEGGRPAENRKRKPQMMS